MNRLIELARSVVAMGGLNNYEKLDNNEVFARCGKHRFMIIGSKTEIQVAIAAHRLNFLSCKLDLTVNNSKADFTKWQNEYNYEVVSLQKFQVPDAF